MPRSHPCHLARPLAWLTVAAALGVATSTLAAALPAAPAPAFWRWAPTPPMGWNSWDSFATTVTEAQVKAEADTMAARLRAHGWQYVIVDIQWYEGGATGYAYRQGARLTMDGYGRLLPAPNKFPSAADGAGFKPLADYVHHLGLKFGVHLMRGIPRQAVTENLPILGTPYHARDIADLKSVCAWNPDMYGVDMTRPGAQAYYDSVFAQLAAWGIDYVKVDDIARPYRAAEIAAIRRAIDRTGRPIVLSLSPGATPLSAALNVEHHANLWRISDDFWDRWLALREQFGRLEKWNPYRRPGAWPDADMLPLGVLAMGHRTTRFTPVEQRTLLSLWAIARSPLMFGGDMTKLDPATLALLTNDEVLAVNQHSEHNRPWFDRDGLVAWVADVPDSPDKYLAVFNVRNRVRLKAANARFASGDVTRDPSTAARIDVSVAGGNRLFLVLRSRVAGSDRDVGVWRNPRLVLADGTVRSLAAQPWAAADALWDSTRVEKDAAGRPAGIAAQPDSVTEYTLPPGAVRFEATGVVLPRASRPGPMRFLVVVATPANESNAAGAPVAVGLARLGFPEGARIRDLWTHQDQGIVHGRFAPVIPWHGAGLYRLSPVRR